MARRTSHNSHSRNRNRRGDGSSSSRTKIIVSLLSVVAIFGIGFLLWKLLCPSDYEFHRADLDKYVQGQEHTVLLNDGASVYVDMSDGINHAYATVESKTVLQAVINKLAANKAISFFELANSKIVPLELSHTQLYNYMLNPSNYNKQKAPIEQTLSRIIEENKPALLMTDFEEYKGTVIEQAAYAKRYFIDWLAKGYNITFYKWAFVEKGKNKSMFLAVFDDNANRLNSLVNNAVSLTDASIETYVLGSRDFAYPTSSNYVSLKEGGNYHNSKGKDIVTNVMANGGSEDYISYTKPFATATGNPGQFAPLNNLLGVFAEYYPIGVNWKDAIKNSKQMQESGINSEDLYTHLLSNLYIDFGAQDGYSIDDIEVRTFDMQTTMQAISKGESILPQAPEVNMFLKAGFEPVTELPNGWGKVYVDFDEQFNGTFMGDVTSTNLMRANIVISRVSPKISEALHFFSWPGNLSLANSVKETLTAASSNPEGRILYTYYIKTLTE